MAKQIFTEVHEGYVIIFDEKAEPGSGEYFLNDGGLAPKFYLTEKNARKQWGTERPKRAKVTITIELDP